VTPDAIERTCGDELRGAVIQIRQFRWPDYDAVVGLWEAAGRDVLPRDELEAKLRRDPRLFLLAVAGEVVVAWCSAPTTTGADGSFGWRSIRRIVGRASPPA